MFHRRMGGDCWVFVLVNLRTGEPVATVDPILGLGYLGWLEYAGTKEGEALLRTLNSSHSTRGARWFRLGDEMACHDPDGMAKKLPSFEKQQFWEKVHAVEDNAYVVPELMWDEDFREMLVQQKLADRDFMEQQKSLLTVKVVRMAPERPAPRRVGPDEQLRDALGITPRGERCFRVVCSSSFAGRLTFSSYPGPKRVDGVDLPPAGNQLRLQCRVRGERMEVYGKVGDLQDPEFFKAGTLWRLKDCGSLPYGLDLEEANKKRKRREE